MVGIEPLVDRGLGNSSYLVDLGDGSAAVIDPARDPAPYLALAERRRLTIRVAVETHLHADFVSGGRELAAIGAQLVAPAAGGLAHPHRGVADGDEVDLGGLTLEAVATPGHTPEHLAYLLRDGADPVALFSGGTLMAGGVARPDLIAPERTEPLARAAYRVIHDRLLPLPDDLPVLPTHGAGSFCSSTPGGERTTTIGRERATNPLLQTADEDAFVSQLLGGLGTFPPYFLRLREVNRAGPAVHGVDLPALVPLAPRDVADAMADGAVLVDARPITRFASGHVPGAVSIELRDQFATWLGWALPFDHPVVFVLDDDQDERELVARALGVGYGHLVGRLHGGMEAWVAAGRVEATVPLHDAPGDGQDGRTVLDVRQASERAAGHVPCSVHRELGALVDGPGDLSGPLLVHCGHGQRAMTAASLLRRAGVRDVAVTTAGPDELTRARTAGR